MEIFDLQPNDVFIKVESYKSSDLSPEKWAYLHRPYADHHLKFDEWNVEYNRNEINNFTRLI
ncbi:hypothetical protein [Mucilaginibacter sp.]